MTSPEPVSFAERFRVWYAYERDANAKVMRMLNSVPPAARSSPQFTRAVGRMAHLVAARHMWLARLGVVSDRPESWFPGTTLDQLPGAIAAIEQRWTTYLGGLTDPQVCAHASLTREDGDRYQWPLIDLLTQLFGHAWYHRGQVAMLVKDLGGEPVDTDYIFWTGPTRVDGGVST